MKAFLIILAFILTTSCATTGKRLENFKGRVCAASPQIKAAIIEMANQLEQRCNAGNIEPK